MTFSLVLPGVVAVLIAVAAGHVRWSNKPAVAMRLLTAVAALASATAFLVVLAVAVGFAARTSVGLALLERCPRLSLHHSVGTVEGSVALLILAAMTFRSIQVIHRRFSAVKGTRGRHIAVLQTDEPIAYAAPGKPGCVVVSSGLLHQLDTEERRVLFAHERAHLRQNHHRYLLVGALATAIVPMLGRLVDQLRLATERCADEAAVATMGGDREVVAVSIGRAALATASFHGTVGAFGGGSIPTRVEALLFEPAPSIGRRLIVVALLVGVAALAASSIQLHHLWALVAHVCGT